jgi:hypothetical protein
MLTLWNAFIGSWIVGTLPYALFLRCIGARVHPLAAVETLFEYVDGRLFVGAGARVYGFCDVATHKGGPDVLRFGPVHVGERAHMRSMARMWPGSSLGAGSNLDVWTRLHFDEHVQPGYTVRGSPAFAETYDTISHTTATWAINLTRLVLVPLYVIVAFELAARAVDSGSSNNTFLRYVTRFVLAYAIMFTAAPIIKRIAVGRGNYFVDQIGSIAQTAGERIFYSSGGPLWTLYLRAFGANVAYDTVIGNSIPESASKVGLLTAKNGSFISGKVRFQTAVCVDNSECMFGAVIPPEGLKDQQLMRHGATRARTTTTNTRPSSLWKATILSLFTSWFSVAATVASIYPTFLLCQSFHGKFAVLVVILPAIVVQTVVIFPLVANVVTLAYKLVRIPYVNWFTSFFFMRSFGAQLFFAGSPLYNLSLILSGARVHIGTRFYGNIWDNKLVVIEPGCVVDYCSFVTAHLYFQREFRTYTCTRMGQSTLAEGPSIHIGENPIECH